MLVEGLQVLLASVRQVGRSNMTRSPAVKGSPTTQTCATTAVTKTDNLDVGEPFIKLLG